MFLGAQETSGEIRKKEIKRVQKHTYFSLTRFGLPTLDKEQRIFGKTSEI